LEIIKHCRVKNLIVPRQAIPSKILVTIEHSNCFTTTLQMAVKHSEGDSRIHKREEQTEERI